MNDFFLSLLLAGALSSGNSLPFWATTNQWGLMPENNGALTVLQAHTQYDDSKTFQWRWGVSLAANYDSGTPAALSATGKAADFNFMVDELYASIKWKVFSLDAGMKHVDLDFYGAGTPTLGSMSTTGGHIVFSGNARSMPGYLLNLDPVPLPWTKQKVWLYGSFGDYKTIDNRYVAGALMHRTKIMLRFDILKRLSFHFGFDHYSLWAGNYQNAEMPVTFDNYFRIITGRHASSAGSLSDQLNVIGDHGGGELMRFDWRGDGWKAVFQHDIPYNDGSGMGFQNFPDGVNTLWFGFDDKDRWVSDIVYEHQYTMLQSGVRHDRPTTPEERAKLDPSDQYHYWKHIVGGCDNYFNNGEYRSGWTHFGRTIGDPLFVPKGTRNRTWTGRAMVLGVENNRLRAHHFSIAGKLFKKLPYKAMLTYSKNYGTYHANYAGESQLGKKFGSVKETPLRQLSGALVGEVPVGSFAFTWGIYADYGSLLEHNFGASLGVRYMFSAE